MDSEVVVIDSESDSDDEVIVEKKLTIPSSPPLVTSSIPSDFSIPSTILRKNDDHSRAFKSKSMPNVATPGIAARLFGLDSDPLNLSPLGPKESEVIVLSEDEAGSGQDTNPDPFITDGLDELPRDNEIPTSPDIQPGNDEDITINTEAPASSFEVGPIDQVDEVVIIDSLPRRAATRNGSESEVICTQEVMADRVFTTPKPRRSAFGLTSDELDQDIDHIFDKEEEPSTQQLVNCISSSSQNGIPHTFSSSQSIGVVPNTQSSIGRTLSLNTGSEILSPKPASPMLARKTKSAAPRKTREERAKEKEQAQENKLKKKALEAANRSKRGRTDSTAEVILNVTSRLRESAIGSKVIEALGEFGADILEWDCDDVEHVDLIKYERKVTARYDHEEDIYVPCDLEIHEESQGIVYVEAGSFVKLLDLNIFESHLEKVQSLFEGKRVIYIIQGLQQILRKAANEKNREVAARVRQLMNPSAPSTQKKTKATKTSSTKEVDTKEIELALTRMEVELGIRVLHTANFVETSELIVDLTHDIGAAPYKRTKLLTDENVDIGTIRSGVDARDTFVKSLQQIKYVTPGVAQAISSHYSGLVELQTSLNREGADVLVGIRKGDTGRAIGRALADQIRTIFNSKDPNEFVSM